MAQYDASGASRLPSSGTAALRCTPVAPTRGANNCGDNDDDDEAAKEEASGRTTTPSTMRMPGGLAGASGGAVAPADTSDGNPNDGGADGIERPADTEPPVMDDAADDDDGRDGS